MIQERNCDEKKLWGQALFISAAGDGHRQLRQGWNAGRHERRLGRHRGGGDKIFLCLSSNHKTVENILERKAFTVSVADEAHLVEADYVGLVSGNEVPDKLERSGFHVTRSEFVDAPVIDELPLVLECRLLSYDPNTHFMAGEIVNAGADEAILDEAGMIDPAKLKPLTFDPANGTYWSLGEKMGKAFSDGSQLK